MEKKIETERRKAFERQEEMESTLQLEKQKEEEHAKEMQRSQENGKLRDIERKNEMERTLLANEQMDIEKRSKEFKRKMDEERVAETTVVGKVLDRATVVDENVKIRNRSEHCANK